MLKRSFAGRDSLWFGLAVIALSFIIGTFAYMRSAQTFTPATGTIISTEFGSPGGRTTEGSQRVHYRYQANGKDYEGEAFTRVTGVSGVLFHVGAAIPIYYEQGSPAVSYLISPPRSWSIVGEILLFALLGLVVIISGWTR